MSDHSVTEPHIHFTGRQLVRRLRLLVSIKHLLHHFIEDSPMALDPAVQAAVDDLTAAVDTETTQITGIVQGLIDRINAGANPSEIVAALSGLKSRIDGISDALPTPPTP